MDFKTRRPTRWMSLTIQPHRKLYIGEYYKTSTHFIYLLLNTDWRHCPLALGHSSRLLRTPPDSLHTSQPLVMEAGSRQWPLITLVHDNWPHCPDSVCLLFYYCSMRQHLTPQPLLDLFTDKNWLLHCQGSSKNCSLTEMFIPEQGIILWTHRLRQV